MDSSLYIAANHAASLRDRLTITAENVANVNTSGFRRLVADYSTVQPDARVDAHYGVLQPEYFDTRSGPLVNTDNPLDVAIVGDGYFAIQQGGQVRYTRSGQFTTDAQGNLMTMQGHQVLSAGLGPITLPADAQDITINEQGFIGSDQGILGQIGVFQFTQAQQRQFVRSGDNAFAAPANAIGTPPLDENTRVIQGAVEGSNVNNVTEVTNLTEVTRSYQSTLRMIQSIEELEQRAIRTLPSTN